MGPQVGAVVRPRAGGRGAGGRGGKYSRAQVSTSVVKKPSQNACDIRTEQASPAEHMPRECLLANAAVTSSWAHNKGKEARQDGLSVTLPQVQAWKVTPPLAHTPLAEGCQ